MNKYKYMSLIIVTTFLMGIAFPIGKIGLSYAPPFFLMGLRYVLAGGLLAIIVAKRPRPRGRKQWLQALAIGLIQSAGVMGCVYYSMYWITSSESAIITSISPLIVIIIATLFAGAIYSGRQWLGVVLGFIGVAFTFGLHMSLQPGTFISFGGAACFAAATLLIKRWGPGFDMTVLAAYQMLAGGAVLLLISAFTEHPYFTISVKSISILLWLAIFCSIIQFSIWFYLLRSGDAAKTSSFLFLAPFFGVLSSWLLLGEQVKWYALVGGVFICIGIFLVNGESKAKRVMDI
jgi:drug/metabolite transporter (DMT)-like permease